MAAKHFAIIPARSGSKRVKNKNLTKFNGKTLVALAAEEAMKSKIFSKVIVTTDYNKNELGLEHLRSNFLTELRYVKRPDNYATDKSMMIDVIKSCLDNVREECQWIWVLQPTSPFRQQIDFKNIFNITVNDKYESIISFAPASDNIERLYSVVNNKAKRLKYTNFKNAQELKQLYTRSGNFYVIRKSYIDEYEYKDPEHFDWAPEPSYTYMMGNIGESKEYNDLMWSMKMGTNIDNDLDLDIAKEVIRRGDYIVRWS